MLPDSDGLEYFVRGSGRIQFGAVTYNRDLVLTARASDRTATCGLNLESQRRHCEPLFCLRELIARLKIHFRGQRLPCVL